MSEIINKLKLTTFKIIKLNQVTNNEAFISYGKVLSCKDGIIKVAGLRSMMAGEVVKFGDGQMGLISNLRKNSVSAVVLGDDTAICQGDLVTSTGACTLLYPPARESVFISYLRSFFKTSKFWFYLNTPCVCTVANTENQMSAEDAVNKARVLFKELFEATMYESLWEYVENLMIASAIIALMFIVITYVISSYIITYLHNRNEKQTTYVDFTNVKSTTKYPPKFLPSKIDRTRPPKSDFTKLGRTYPKPLLGKPKYDWVRKGPIIGSSGTTEPGRVRLENKKPEVQLPKSKPAKNLDKFYSTLKWGSGLVLGGWTYGYLKEWVDKTLQKTTKTGAEKVIESPKMVEAIKDIINQIGL